MVEATAPSVGLSFGATPATPTEEWRKAAWQDHVSVSVGSSGGECKEGTEEGSHERVLEGHVGTSRNARRSARRCLPTLVLEEVRDCLSDEPSACAGNKKYCVQGYAGQRETECAICLEEYKEGDEVTKLPCQHTFHRGRHVANGGADSNYEVCVGVLQWLKTHNSCPICRRATRL